jgi:hypothetical protein
VVQLTFLGKKVCSKSKKAGKILIFSIRIYKFYQPSWNSQVEFTPGREFTPGMEFTPGIHFDILETK